MAVATAGEFGSRLCGEDEHTDLFGFKKRAADREQREKKLAKLCALVDANYAFAANALRRLPPKERKHAIAHRKHIVGNMGDLRERNRDIFDDRYQQVFRDEFSRTLQEDMIALFEEKVTD